MLVYRDTIYQNILKNHSGQNIYINSMSMAIPEYLKLLRLQSLQIVMIVKLYYSMFQLITNSNTIIDFRIDALGLFSWGNARKAKKILPWAKAGSIK